MNLGFNLFVILLAIIFGMFGSLILSIISVSFALLIEWISKMVRKK